jgi:hypothetical protein
MRADIVMARGGLASLPVTVGTASFQNGARRHVPNKGPCSTKPIHGMRQLTLSGQAGASLAAFAGSSILERGNGLYVS